MERNVQVNSRSNINHSRDIECQHCTCFCCIANINIQNHAVFFTYACRRKPLSIGHGDFDSERTRDGCIGDDVTVEKFEETSQGHGHGVEMFGVMCEIILRLRGLVLISWQCTINQRKSSSGKGELSITQRSFQPNPRRVYFDTLCADGNLESSKL
jgi:hypothetical protein